MQITIRGSAIEGVGMDCRILNASSRVYSIESAGTEQSEMVGRNKVIMSGIAKRESMREFMMPHPAREPNMSHKLYYVKSATGSRVARVWL